MEKYSQYRDRDLQIDGVKRGSLAKQDKKRLPHGGTIIASSFTSPLDALYLAAIFDPIFTISYPSTRLVQRVTCFRAILHALSKPADVPPPNATLVPIAKLIAQNPDASIVVFPECTTTNGRGILPFSPSLLTVPAKTKVFPVSLRYTPADVATPVPGTYFKFLWNLCSKPTHCIRVRIAEAVFNTAGFKLEIPSSSTGRDHSPQPNSRMSANAFEGTPLGEGISEYAELGSEEKKVLDRVGEDLARLGRVKRLGLGVREKSDFVKAWSKKRR
ncbi:Lysophosphatidic acid:oleoyl-CoA acyltransferase 1 [Diplodia intermedia]|uniref:Lysophosphatidic acid:oleoyl-CoA acyltransferase 1 n=1 Tax=Diplodia intermedia TaxID=856260 RepID=A0ABR3TTL0_9PEZI